MDHHLACYLGMKVVRQSRSVKELVLGCCVPGSSFLTLPFMENNLWDEVVVHV